MSSFFFCVSRLVPWLMSFNLQARAGITELHFLPFNPVDKRTALTYTDAKGNWHRASKGAPEQVIQHYDYLYEHLIFFVQNSCE